MLHVRGQKYGISIRRKSRTRKATGGIVGGRGPAEEEVEGEEEVEEELEEEEKEVEDGLDEEEEEGVGVLRGDARLESIAGRKIDCQASALSFRRRSGAGGIAESRPRSERGSSTASGGPESWF